MTDTQDTARLWIEIWNTGDPRTLPLADNFVHTSPFGMIQGRKNYLDTVMPLAKENVAKLHVEDVIAEDDRACVLFTMDTPGGPIACCDWVTFRDGKITAVRSHYDPRGLGTDPAY